MYSEFKQANSFLSNRILVTDMLNLFVESFPVESLVFNCVSCKFTLKWKGKEGVRFVYLIANMWITMWMTVLCISYVLHGHKLFKFLAMIFRWALHYSEPFSEFFNFLVVENNIEDNITLHAIWSLNCLSLIFFS